MTLTTDNKKSKRVDLSQSPSISEREKYKYKHKYHSKHGSNDNEVKRHHNKSSKRHRRRRRESPRHSHHRHSKRRHRSNSRVLKDKNEEIMNLNKKDEDVNKVIEPKFGLSGKLAEEANMTSKGTVLKYVEPPEAGKPDLKWRLYVFKDGEPFGEPIPIHRLSCYLFGRDRSVADIPTDHPSCSKQHLVLQYRVVQVEDEQKNIQEVVKPYIMDLGSVNGTFLNKRKLEPQRYYELLERDSLIIGLSTRDYVLLHEGSL